MFNQSKTKLYNPSSLKAKIWVGFFLVLGIVILLLPWTQNIDSKGSITTLKQEHRPQTINSVIAGKILKWYIKEGDMVKKGDTLAELGEVKIEYLDPKLIENTRQQLLAKNDALKNYEQKAQTSLQQISALAQSLELKTEQLETKLSQLNSKLIGDSAEYKAALNDYQTALIQYERNKKMHESGLISLIQLEQRNVALQNSKSKKIGSENKILQTTQEIKITQIELRNIQQDYSEKISKVEGDRLQSLSMSSNANGELTKLENQLENYIRRNNLYFIIAPQNGQISKAYKSGIGEILKEGEAIAEIVPNEIQYAAEIYINPIDLPLLHAGQKVSLIFDGYPAIAFSGWPEASYGVFTGIISAIENNVNNQGKLRILVIENANSKPWPKTLRNGVGVRCIALLNTVKVGYELWRIFNGFPPDYYIIDKNKQIKTTEKK